MSFFKKFGRQKSVDLEESAKKKEEKEKSKELKRSKRHSVHVTRRERKDEPVVAPTTSKDDMFLDEASQRKREAELKERERRKFKDMSGMVTTSPNEYPIFTVHYLGRMPADAEYGREAVEDPVHQLCKLREKQKLPKMLLAFNVEGMMCREVTGPFLKPKKEGFTFFVPLHHITYGVGSLSHPQVFAVITKMTDDPTPVNQVLVLHAFVCDKPEEAQALTYWQLQAYIEAFEELKRKRMLKMRRKQALPKSYPEPLQSPVGGQTNTPNMTEVPSVPKPSSSSQPSGKSVAAAKLPAKATKLPLKATRTNSSASTTSSSSSNSSTKKNTSDSSFKSSDTSTKSDDSQPTNNHSYERVIPLAPKPKPGHLSPDIWPPKRGPPQEMRGPPIDDALDNVVPRDAKRVEKESAEFRDSAFVEGEEDLTPSTAVASPTPLPSSSSLPSSPPPPSSPSQSSPPSSSLPPSSPPPQPPSSQPTSSATASTTREIPPTRSSIPGIAPRKTSESEAGNRSCAFETRISELQGLVELDAEKMKKLMLTEYPTLSRKILYKLSVDDEGMFFRQEDEEEGQLGISDDSMV